MIVLGSPFFIFVTFSSSGNTMQYSIFTLVILFNKSVPREFLCMAATKLVRPHFNGNEDVASGFFFFFFCSFVVFLSPSMITILLNLRLEFPPFFSFIYLFFYFIFLVRQSRCFSIFVYITFFFCLSQTFNLLWNPWQFIYLFGFFFRLYYYSLGLNEKKCNHSTDGVRENPSSSDVFGERKIIEVLSIIRKKK